MKEMDRDKRSSNFDALYKTIRIPGADEMLSDSALAVSFSSSPHLVQSLSSFLQSSVLSPPPNSSWPNCCVDRRMEKDV